MISLFIHYTFIKLKIIQNNNPGDFTIWHIIEAKEMVQKTSAVKSGEKESAAGWRIQEVSKVCRWSLVDGLDLTR